MYNWKSNYYAHKIKHGEITHNTVEHAYQYAKAKQYGDVITANKILGAPSPEAAKGFGYEVTRFDKKDWDGRKQGIMLSILRNKFADGTDLATLLKKTKGKKLAEAGKSTSLLSECH